MTVLVPDRLFGAERIRTGAAVAFDGACISATPDGASPGANRLRGLLAPGSIDLQVNGGGGVLFGDPPRREARRLLLAVHMGRGVTGVMARLISSDRTAMTAAMSAVGEALWRMLC
jgi:N-acetylglucosamine-6-phosphate deacetylase